MTKNPWTWCTATNPFSALDKHDEPALFVVEQISDTEFRIPTTFGFQYNPDGGESLRVTGDSLPTTDFASIPRYMSWLVSRHGRHTPAALVHDQLVVPGMDFEDRKVADRLFRDMMDALEVPPVLSRVMWAAVTLATRATGPVMSKIGVAAWAVAAAAGMTLLAAGVVTTTPWMIALALVLPFLAGLLWGSQFWAGVVAGYALPVVAGPALASLLGYWLYWIIEMAVKLVRQQFQQNKDQDLTEPVGYQGR